MYAARATSVKDWENRRQCHCALKLDALCLRHYADVLVAAAAEADQDDAVGRQRGGEFGCAVDGVGRLEGGDDALGAAEQVKALEGLGVGDLAVDGAFTVFEVAVLGADAGVVQARGDAVGRATCRLRLAAGRSSRREARRGVRR